MQNLNAPVGCSEESPSFQHLRLKPYLEDPVLKIMLSKNTDQKKQEE